MPAKKNIPGYKLTQAGKPAGSLRRNTLAKKRGGQNNQGSVANKGPQRFDNFGPQKVKSTSKPTTLPKPGHVWAMLRPGVWIQSNTNRPVSSTNPKPRPNNPAKAGYKWTRKNGRWLQVKIPSSGAGKKKVSPSDPRRFMDSQYRRDIAQLQFDKSRGLNDIDARLGTLKSQYDIGSADLFKNYDRGRYDSNAELASRGIFNSGERMGRAVNMQDQLGRGQLDLSNQYGEGAIRGLTAERAGLNNQYNLSQQQAYGAARDRFSQRRPASNYIFRTLGNTKNG